MQDERIRVLDVDRIAGRNGAGSKTCPGCEDLSIAMKRTLSDHELLITVRRMGSAKDHLEECVMGLVLRELATRLLP